MKEDVFQGKRCLIDFIRVYYKKEWGEGCRVPRKSSPIPERRKSVLTVITRLFTTRGSGTQHARFFHSAELYTYSQETVNKN